MYVYNKLRKFYLKLFIIKNKLNYTMLRVL